MDSDKTGARQNREEWESEMAKDYHKVLSSEYISTTIRYLQKYEIKAITAQNHITHTRRNTWLVG